MHGSHALLGSADQGAEPSVLFFVMPREALQGDPQDDLARSRRPAKTLLGGFKPFEQTAAPKRHIPKACPELSQGVFDPPIGGDWRARANGSSARLSLKDRTPVALAFRFHLAQIRNLP